MIGGISDVNWQKIIGIISQYKNIEAVILYGSRAKGNFQDGSDIDLAFKGRDIFSEQLTRISMDYEDLFLPWKLSLTVYSDIVNTELTSHIDRVGIDILSLFK
ncbi:MAG: nucleotidyltransferase domain-containing protein [Pseudomonadota bacterium]